MSLRFGLFALLVGLVTLPGVAIAQSIAQPDGTMVFFGSLTESADGKVFPADGDIVSVVNVATNQTEATAIYGSGIYALSVSKPAKFNGTQLAFRLTQAGTVYKLLFATGGDAIILFNAPPIFPVQVKLNLVVSSAAGTGTGSSTPPPITSTLVGDINGDGKVDEEDIQLLKQALSGQVAINKSTMELNGDAVVNTRDLIDLIRMVREKLRVTLRPTSIIPVR